MLTLSMLLRETVAGGHPAEVIADAGQQPPLVTAVIIDGRRVAMPGGGDSGRGDLRLVRDLLDVQVLDREGHHRGRVGDVELDRGEDGSLRVVAVETGLRPVLRRLGLGRLAARASFDRVECDQLHARAGRAHAYTAELHDRPRRYRGVFHARRRPPR